MPNRETKGFALTPAVQTSVCAGIRSPFESTASVPSNDSSVVETWISTPRRDELARRILAQPRWDLRQDLRRRVDEDPALRGSAQLRVPAEGVGDEIRELGERLDARVTGSDEHEAEVRRGAQVGVGGLELA